MVINDKNNFVGIIAKLLTGLEYENVQVTKGDNKLIDITAEKSKEKFCFKCRYDIDAIGDTKIQEFVDTVKTDKNRTGVYVTNSSFLASAKTKAEEAGVLLWDRNLIDRLAIGVPNAIEDEIPEPKGHKKIYVLLALIGVVVITAIIYFSLFL